MNQTQGAPPNTEPTLEKSISYLGFIAIGVGCVFGSSWLVMGGPWIDKAGGPLNAIIAFIVYTILILIIAKSYLDIVKILPKANGESDFCKEAFGDRLSFFAGWCSFLVNTLICAWQTLAISKMASYLFEGGILSTTLYTIGGYPITIINIIFGIALVILIAALQIKGTKALIRLQFAISVIVFGVVALSMAITFRSFDFNNLLPLRDKSIIEGGLSLMVILPFSIAGWETIAKGSVESKNADSSKLGKAMYVSILLSSFLYLFILLYQSGLIPWKSLISSPLPYVTGVNAATGNKILGLIIVFAACVNIVGVYNGMLFGAVRSLLTLSTNGYLPKKISYIHKKYKSPIVAIIIVSICAATVPFLGGAAFGSLVNSAAFLYILLWGTTAISTIKLKAMTKGKKPGIRDYLLNGSILSLLFLGGSMLFPLSPGALSYPDEYIMIACMLILGAIVRAGVKIQNKQK